MLMESHPRSLHELWCARERAEALTPSTHLSLPNLHP